MSVKTKVKSDTDTINKPTSVIGQYSGKCCDSNVFNNNDMHLPRELFEKVMESDEFKRAMKNRHYIGYAGHPDDSDCQDFEHACIVMTDMKIEENGEITGTFDLIDTPVGRVIKAFIDAGVKFGISIRGLGEVDSNGEVDPEEFIFRGFDLVTFPAYDDCIPEFKSIAASTDAKKQAKLKKVYSSIDANLKDINSCEALTVIQEQLPDGCDEFNKVQERIEELTNPVLEQDIVAEVTEEKLKAMTELYLDAAADVRELEDELTAEQLSNQELTLQCKTLKQKWARLDKIVAKQIVASNRTIEDLEDKYDRSAKQLREVRANLAVTQDKLSEAREKLDSARSEYNKQVVANTQLKDRLNSLIQKRKDDKEAIRSSDNLNLKYKQRIEATSETISQKDSEIEDLKNQLNETVVAADKLRSEASNLDDKNQELLSRVEAAEEMVLSYQQAYANIYANALGVYIKDLPITARTSVQELTDMIKSATSTANIASNPSYYYQDEDVDEEYDDSSDDDINYSAEMVTL